MTPTEPLDAVHADSILAVAAIRDHVRWLRWVVATWTPRPCPAVTR